MKMLTLCFLVGDSDLAQGIARKNARGFDAKGFEALLDVGVVAEARLTAIPRPGGDPASPRYAALLLCTSFEGPMDIYFEEFFKRLPHEFIGLGLAALEPPFPVTPELVKVVVTGDKSESALALLSSLMKPFVAFTMKHDLTSNVEPLSKLVDPKGTAQFIRPAA